MLWGSSGVHTRCAPSLNSRPLPGAEPVVQAPAGQPGGLRVAEEDPSRTLA